MRVKPCAEKTVDDYVDNVINLSHAANQVYAADKGGFLLFQYKQNRKSDYPEGIANDAVKRVEFH